jgi:hypothetical protein
MTPDQTNVMFKNMLLAEQAQISTLKTQQISMLQGQAQQPATPMPGAAQGISRAYKAVCEERDAAYQALREAQEITKEWQSAMEAWRDLAQTLRDEVKACPNHEAHKFGKDDTARIKRFNNHEDDGRAKRGLKPRDRPNQK